MIDELRFIRTDDVPPKVVAALSDRVLRGDEQRVVIGRPLDAADAGNSILEQLPGPQILHVQCILPISRRVGRKREKIAVVAHRHGAKGEEANVLRHLVLVN